MVLVDTNVLIDILVKDRVWLDWSAEQLDRCRRSSRICTNEVGYAELAARIDSQASLEDALDSLGIALERMPIAALFAAGQAFRRYRAAGGPRLNALADFFLGAHAQSLRITILTRDVRRYRTYFSDVTLIAPV
ncbi:type II toxin-antitoxin system VapC family toxin [Pseudolabrys sp. FHR47]|uniref:type II toxin-antitoxin system VapC family toxin n=1 Tax=Pseudolabrys sp. FHR47 TaxID=2562284 RepID=UPI0010BE5FB5|nr:type II toxin-antitoxin system VapC family toxin [Pseudolabrys sp. FHR47]